MKNTTNYPTITNTAPALTARKPAGVCAIQPTRCLSRVGGERYMMLNPKVVTGAQPCPYYEQKRKKRFAWGISRIYDNVRMADLKRVRHEVMMCFGSEVYYKVKQQRRAITEEEQKMVRLSFTEMGYDGSAIEFDRYEEQYAAVMRLARYS